MGLLPSLLLLLFVVDSQSLELTLTPDDVTVTEGSNANFACSPLLQGTTSILFRTITPGASESEAIMENKLTVTDISSVRIFTWLNASRDDDGRMFFCWFGATMSNIATLYVNYPPTISADAIQLTLMAGKSLNITIGVDGRPTPTLSWSLNGVKLQKNSKTLLITNVSLADAGLYVATAKNEVHEVSTNFSVIVKSKPIFVNINQGVSVRAGAEFVINCAAYAYPSIKTIILTMNMKKLQLDSDNKYTILRAQTCHGGEYVCNASNEIGSKSLKILIEVKDIPGQVSHINMMYRNNSELVIEWVAGNNNDYFYVIIEYGEIPIMRMVTETKLTLKRSELSVPDSGAELELSITITAFNEIGRSPPVKKRSLVKFEAKSSVSNSADALFTITAIVMCVLLLYILIK